MTLSRRAPLAAAAGAALALSLVLMAPARAEAPAADDPAAEAAPAPADEAPAPERHTPRRGGSLLTPEDQAKLRDAGRQASEVARAEGDRARELARQLKPTKEQLAALRALVQAQLDDPKVKDIARDFENLRRDLQSHRAPRDSSERDSYARDPDQAP